MFKLTTGSKSNCFSLTTPGGKFDNLQGVICDTGSYYCILCTLFQSKLKMLV